MKFGKLLLNTFGVLILVFFIQNLVKAQEGNDVLLPIKNNWGTHEKGNTTEGSMCVKLEGDNVLRLSIYVQTATEEIGYHPSMYIFYTLLGTGLSGITPALTPADFQLVSGSNPSYYRYELKLTYDFSAECNEGVEAVNFTLFYQLLTADEDTYPLAYSPYPMGNQVLWPTYMFGQQPAYAPVHADTKLICCYKNQPPPMGLEMAGGETPIVSDAEALPIDLSTELPSNSQMGKEGFIVTTDLASDPRVFPNPFKEDVNVQFIAEETGQLKLECFNTEGKLVKSVLSVAEFTGPQSTRFDLASIPSGMYYLRISTANWTKTVKVVKSMD